MTASFSVKHICACVLLVVCYFWVIRLLAVKSVKSFLSGYNGCSLGHSVVVLSRSDSWLPRGLWLGLKNAFGDGQWCKMLSLCNCIDFFPSLLPLTQFTLCHVEILSNGLCFYSNVCFHLWCFNGCSVFFGRLPSLRCVLFAGVTPTHYLPVHGSYWSTFFIFIIFLFSNM